MSMDEGERGFRAEKEIARESEKKVVNLREIRRSPKKLRRKLKPGKTEKVILFKALHVIPNVHSLF